jgi:hypothetical protein
MVKNYIELMGEECKDEFFKELVEKANQMRIEILFEEPCPLYEEVDDELD